MNLLRTMIVSVGLFGLAACAGTEQQAASAPKSTASVATAESSSSTEATATTDGQMVERKVCKRIHVTGTRFPKKVCMTKQEWQEASDRAQEDLDQNIMDSQAATGDSGG